MHEHQFIVVSHSTRSLNKGAENEKTIQSVEEVMCTHCIQTMQRSWDDRNRIWYWKPAMDALDNQPSTPE